MRKKECRYAGGASVMVARMAACAVDGETLKMRYVEVAPTSRL